MCGSDTPQREAAHPMKNQPQRFLSLCLSCSEDLSRGAKSNHATLQPDHIKRSTEPHTRPAFSERLRDRFSSEGWEHSVSGGRKPQRHERTGADVIRPITTHPQPELGHYSTSRRLLTERA